MYKVHFASPARRAIKKLSRSGRFDTEEIYTVVNALRDGRTLDPSYDDHQLQGSMAHYRECHLAFDLLLIYEVDKELETLTIVKIGTHDEIFS
jgi:mRNA interferase YafQ